MPRVRSTKKLGLYEQNRTNASSCDICYSDEAHLTSFGWLFQAKEETKENKRSVDVFLLCAGLLRSGLVCGMYECLKSTMAFCA